MLVTIFQRGAMDGVMAVQPLNDANLQKIRPGLLLPASKEGLLTLDDRFGIHPGGSALHKLYQQKLLGVVHGIGSPDTTRSQVTRPCRSRRKAHSAICCASAGANHPAVRHALPPEPVAGGSLTHCLLIRSQRD